MLKDLSESVRMSGIHIGFDKVKCYVCLCYSMNPVHKMSSRFNIEKNLESLYTEETPFVRILKCRPCPFLVIEKRGLVTHLFCVPRASNIAGFFYIRKTVTDVNNSRTFLFEQINLPIGDGSLSLYSRQSVLIITIPNSFHKHLGEWEKRRWLDRVFDVSFSNSAERRSNTINLSAFSTEAGRRQWLDSAYVLFLCPNWMERRSSTSCIFNRRNRRRFCFAKCVQNENDSFGFVVPFVFSFFVLDNLPLVYVLIWTIAMNKRRPTINYRPTPSMISGTETYSISDK
jgi:hypothetical protein